MAANMKMAVFWVVALCGMVEVSDVSEVLASSIIRAMIALMMEAGSTKRLPDYTAQESRRQSSSIYNISGSSRD
jgi:hypothetical protein